jgi:MFS transporter, PPP family, 3-phenylpropionic acid transporter
VTDAYSVLERAGKLRRLTPLLSFLVLYAVLYAAFGAASPFLPALIEDHGIAPEQIGMLLAAGTAIRLISAPIAGRIADRTQALRLTLAICAIGTALAALGYLTAWSFWAILAVSLMHAFALAPTTNLADALALVASRRREQGFEYGWVRGAGSAAFILGSILAGWAMSSYELSIIVWLQALLMLLVPLAARWVPPVDAEPREANRTISRTGVLALVRLPVFRRVVLVAALILGSHAMHDTFAVIRWRAAGINPQTVSLLWSMSVAAEVVVFFLIGPWLLRKLTPAGAIALAGLAGAARWLVAAFTADVAALALIQPLHGFTFALLHLACMRLLADTVPAQLAATAQAIYGTVGIGVATALLTLLSGWLYARMGPHAFAVMSVLCLADLPIAASLRPAPSVVEAK